LTKRRNKFNAVKTEVDGIKFDSKAEARRWGELQLLVRAGEINNLTRQVRINLTVNDVHCGASIIDFQYFDIAKNRTVLEDVKGYIGPTAATQLWKLKFKLVEALTGTPVEIVK
jgi:hypothetical protein